ncbi:MAG: 5'-nucleotidase C-terminal domain-containing protein [Candidatus Eisenbacteria bacterium]|nr:5'-nucleotidase C-terminal domain-containing protein [Candidatus Eisenbacteria bacterium]
MNRTLRIFCAAVMLMGFAAGTNAQPADTLVVIHINDTHSHVSPYGPKNAQGVGSWGGIARAATIIGQTQAMNENTLFLHAGDLFIGDFMFNAYFGVAELQLLAQLGCDAFTLGNHEFDLTPQVLEMAIAASGHPFDFLCANMDAPHHHQLRDMVKPFTIKDVNGIKVGIFGLTTLDTNDFSLPAPAVITPFIEAAEAAVDSLRERCSVIIALSHLGLTADQELGAAVSGIDVIVGGHSHDATMTPVVVTNPMGRPTTIVQAGEFYSYVGALKLAVRPLGTEVISHQLTHIDDSVPEVPQVAAAVQMLIAGIEADPRFGPAYTEVIAEAGEDFTREFDHYSDGCKDTQLGNLVADAFRDTTQTDVALTVWGFISQGLWAGALTGADIFQTVPYGYDEASGLDYPLVTFELTGLDLITGLEVALEAAEGASMNDLWPQVSNIKVKYHPANGVGQWIWSAEVGGAPIDFGVTYTVTANLAVATLLPVIAGVQPQNVQMTGITEYEALRGYIMEHSPVMPDTVCRIEQVMPLAVASLTGVADRALLIRNEPNPFKHATGLSYALPTDGTVRLEVFTLAGHRVATLVDEWQPAGTRSVEWDAGHLPSGIYIQRLQCGDRVVSRPMTLLR